MPRGRKPLPAEIRRLHGRSHKKKKSNGTIPRVPIGAPGIPPLVADDPDALAAWNQLKKDFLTMKVLSKKDGTALSMLCLALADVKRSRALIQKHGYVVQRLRKGRKEIVSNPAVAVYNKAVQTVYRFSTEFGLTPASGVRVREVDGDEAHNASTPQGAAQESAESFLFGKKDGTTGKVIPIKRRK